jgi:hypothetical protein
VGPFAALAGGHWHHGSRRLDQSAGRDPGRPPTVEHLPTRHDEPPELGRGKRGGAADSVELVGLWSDLDIDGPGHKHDPGKYGGRVLPPDEPSARKIVEVAALPMSTVWIHSGGGLYGWWLLYVPFTVTGDSRGCGWAVETLAGRLGRWRGVAGLLLRHGCVRSGPSAAAARNGQPQGPRGPATVPHSVQWRAASCIG